MKPIVIFGTELVAKISHFYFQHDSDRTVAAFTVDSAYLKEPEFCGLPLVPFETIETTHPPDQYDLFIAIGYNKVNQIRAQKYLEARQKNYQLARYVSSKATVWPGVEIGDNCLIMEDNTLQPFVKVGNNVILWSGNHVGHDAEIGDHCFIASHVVISGGVKVGNFSFLGVNATIRDQVMIGQSCVIGAGSLILKNTPDYGVYTAPEAELSKVPSNRLRRI